MPMKILMVLMSLDIGGAETHVTELSKELKRQGHEIGVVSAGGAYVSDIEAAGIKHFYAPLNKHSGMPMAYFTLKRVISEFKPDIVHAHARLPAFLCHLIHKTNKRFAFVTSAHGTYDTRGIIGFLSRWGSRQMAVSDDIKRYLIQNYRKIKPHNIYVSVNGVDTEKFSADVSADDFINEFGLNPLATRIVYVSRLENNVCAGAYALMRLAPRLSEKISGLEIVLVGDGGCFEELKASADEVNTAAGRRVVIMTGARTDICKINASADFCVATSRSALEEMAQEKPCILAGSFGYMGIFNEDKLASAMGNNFTCRGTHDIDDDELFNDILELYRMTKEQREALGAYSRSVVVQNYSLRKMVKDNLKMYDDALAEGNYDAAILGYYGYRNSGDDTLLHAIIGSLRKRKPDIRIAVFSNMPEETAKIYGVHSENRFDIFAVRKVLKHTKLFIMGGGSLLQDGTSRRSIVYYTACLNMAKRLCGRTMLYANGVGPFLHKSSIKLAARALRGVNIITLRDKDSAGDLKKIGIDDNVFVTADPVFSLRNSLTGKTSYELEYKGIKKGEKYICVSPRCFKGQPENFEKSFANLCDYVVREYGYKVVFLPMQYPYDAKIIRSIQKEMQEESVFIASRLSAEDMLNIISGSEFAVGVRLHLLIYASTAGVPGIGIVYDPKVSGFQRYISQPYFIQPRSLASGDCITVIDECVKNKEEISESLKNTAEEMEQKSEQTADMAIKLIKETEGVFNAKNTWN